MDAVAKKKMGQWYLFNTNLIFPWIALQHWSFSIVQFIQTWFIEQTWGKERE